jgi:hypothetical protein
MIVPTFVDLQGFTVKEKFVVKEVAVLKRGNVLTHYIFTNSVPWSALTKSERSCVSWLTAYHHGLRWGDGIVQYWKAKHLITTAVYDENDNEAIVYVKGHEKREWLKNILDVNVRNDVIIETVDADYEDIESLNNLDTTNTIKCGKHVKNCAMQNVFKLYNCWLQYQKDTSK